MTPKLLAAAALAAALALPAHGTLYQVGPTRGAARDQLTDVVNLLNPGDVVEVDGSAAGAPPNNYNAVKFTRGAPRRIRS